jgi:hypothetical protein
MKATGEMAKQKEEVLSTIKTEMSILVSLKMTGQMDTVHMSMRMDKDMRDTGSMICSMAKV